MAKAKCVEQVKELQLIIYDDYFYNDFRPHHSLNSNNHKPLILKLELIFILSILKLKLIL